MKSGKKIRVAQTDHQKFVLSGLQYGNKIIVDSMEAIADTTALEALK